MIDSRIFRAYDIRGEVPSQLNGETCRLVGQAFGTILRRTEGSEHPLVIVGRDARTHGPELEKALVEGLQSTGCVIRLIGQTPTPVNYFAVATTDCAGGIQVTASHNPAKDNGLKLSTRGMHAFSGDKLQELRSMIEASDFEQGYGSIENHDYSLEYAKKLITKFDRIGEGLTIVVDSGNGVAGPLNCDVLQKIGCTVHELYTEPDGRFPNHAADPSKHATLRELQETVVRVKADIGLAFDGDGDRVGIVDEQGRIRSADEILLLLTQDHLTRHPGGTIVFTVSNSSLLETETKKWGGTPVMCKVGHSCVEETMEEHHSLLGGEQSGHFFCGEDTGGYDDALVAALRILSVLHAKKQTASSLFDAFPTVYQAQERRPHCDDDKKKHVVQRATAFFEHTHPVNTLDGARIDFGDGAWAGIRFSNTSPCLSICMEARSEEALARMEEEVLKHLETYPEIRWEI